jgi:hypothetical protein
MTILLAEKISGSSNLSLLRQQTVNQSFFSIYVYISAALGHVFTIMWPSCRLKMASPDLEDDDDAGTSTGLNREDGE